MFITTAALVGNVLTASRPRPHSAAAKRDGAAETSPDNRILALSQIDILRQCLPDPLLPPGTFLDIRV